MARFLIVGEGGRADALADALERDGQVVGVVAKVERESLAHVSFVYWLDGGSPEGFLLAAIDSSMRGFLHERGMFEQAVSETAARSSIPVAVFDGYGGDLDAWLAGARAALNSLLGDSNGAG